MAHHSENESRLKGIALCLRTAEWFTTGSILSRGTSRKSRTSNKAHTHTHTHTHTTNSKNDKTHQKRREESTQINMSLYFFVFFFFFKSIRSLLCAFLCVCVCVCVCVCECVGCVCFNAKRSQNPLRFLSFWINAPISECLSSGGRVWVRHY